MQAKGWEEGGSTRSASGATSKRMRSFAFVEGDVTFVKTPFSFTIICSRGTNMLNHTHEELALLQ